MKSANYVRNGFTLAEVLITLVIIGVLAAFTIPALYQNIQDAQFKAAWKKEYSMLEQATRRIASENGSLDSFFTSSDNLRNAYLNYFSYIKKQNDSSSDGNCWHGANAWKDYDGTPELAEWGSYAMLSDGSLIVFHVLASVVSAGGVCPPNSGCGYIKVDINGFKGPNTVGKDIFGMTFYSDSISPYGSDKTGFRGTCSTSDTGWGCATLYLRQ